MKFIKFLFSERYRENVTHEFIGIYNQSEDEIEMALEVEEKR